MHIFYAALLSLACASPSPTYERGTLARPPPAQQRPGVGLPTYDPHSKPLPPQPNPKPKRVLPPQNAPGIWAGDEPKGKPQLLPVVGIVLPVPDVDDEDDLGFAPQCAGWLAEGVLDHPEFSKMLNDLPKNERLCVLLDTWGVCLDALVATPEKDGGSARAARLNTGTRRVKDLTDSMLETTCKKNLDKTRPISSTMIGKLIKTLSRPHKPMLVH